MSRIPPESPTWEETPDPDRVVHDLRDQLARARSVVQEHREKMRAAGLTTSPDPDSQGV